MNGSVSLNNSTLLSGSLNVNTEGVVEPININITENGDQTITAHAGVDGYNPINIHTAVPQSTPVLDDITITENGTYTPPTGTDGYDEITVNVSGATANIQSLTTTISSNGVSTLHASDVNCDGFDPVTIRVEVPGFPHYDYETAFDGQIVVRREALLVNNKLVVKTLWFFNGWTKDASDVSIPSNLLPYIPKTTDTVMMTVSFSDNTSATQNGWVGFLYPGDPSSRALRTWSVDKGSTIAGTFWGVLDIDGADEQTRAWYDPYDV